MQRYRREHAIDTVWPVAERVLVCIGSSPASARLVRAGRRLAAQLEAPWVVAYVETPAQRSLGEEDRARVAETLRLAESLGAETVTLTGTRMSDELLAYARSRNVSKIVIGKPTRGFWQRVLLGSIVDTLVRGSGEIDSQYLITFAVMLVVALVISGLTVRTRDQAEAARTQERRSGALFSLSRELAAAREIAPLLEAAVRHLIEVFGGRIVILLPDATGRLEQRAGQLAPFNMDASDLAVAQWAFEHRAAAGAGTDNLPGAQMCFEPLMSSRGVVGVVGMRPAGPA